jgi:hypothetical protein
MSKLQYLEIPNETANILEYSLRSLMMCRATVTVVQEGTYLDVSAAPNPQQTSSVFAYTGTIAQESQLALDRYRRYRKEARIIRVY